MNPGTTYAKGHCLHCDGPIEFDASGAGRVICCPHCGTETALVSAESPPVEQTKPQPSNPNLVNCADCGHEISIRSQQCPKCGAPRIPLRPETCTCWQCGCDIEFDPAIFKLDHQSRCISYGQAIMCPTCGLLTTLTRRRAAASSSGAVILYIIGAVLLLAGQFFAGLVLIALGAILSSIRRIK